MHILLIFLDGVGLGADDPQTNPFAAGDFPTLHRLANNRRWLRGTGRQQTARASFVPVDPRLGVPGRPQSATGQAAIVTGLNVPRIIGEHYGPKPNAPIRDLLTEDNFFKQIVAAGKSAALLETYPPPWHRGIASGKHLPSSYQWAVREAGLPFMTIDDLRAGRALSGDWTAAAWRDRFGYEDLEVLSPEAAGRRLVEASRRYDFAFFSHWMTDVVGHRGELEDARHLLATFDRVMRGVLDAWQDDEGLVIVTSDHGNIEAIGNRRHTENDVPGVIIGDGHTAFAHGLHNLADFVPRMRDLLLPP